MLVTFLSKFFRAVPLAVTAEGIKVATALQKYQAADSSELDVEEEQLIEVRCVDSCGWAFGAIGDRTGWFPCDIIKYKADGDPRKTLQKEASATTQLHIEAESDTNKPENPDIAAYQNAVPNPSPSKTRSPMAQQVALQLERKRTFDKLEQLISLRASRDLSANPTNLLEQFNCASGDLPPHSAKEEGVQLFNTESARKVYVLLLFSLIFSKGLKLLIEQNVLDGSSESIAAFLFQCTELSKEKVGDYLGDKLQALLMQFLLC